MTQSRLILASLILLIAAFSCKRPAPHTSMTVQMVCDSAPALADPAERGPQLPVLAYRSANRASILGTVAEAVSNRPLHNAPVRLLVRDSINGNRVAREVGTNEFGGFAIDSIPPGQYTVSARFIAHQPIERQVTLYAGRSDTLRFMMRRYYCSDAIVTDAR